MEGGPRALRRLLRTDTASRFDNSISWLAAVGNEAALSLFDVVGADAIYERNRELAAALRSSLSEAGWAPIDLADANQSSIVSVPLGDADPASVVAALQQRSVVCAARDGNLRLAVHFYNDEDDIARVAKSALGSGRGQRAQDARARTGHRR